MVSQNVETHWKGREGPFPLLLGPGVFSPTTTSRTLADALEISPGDTVIDVGCGSGVLSIVAAKLGAARVYGVDLSQRAVEAAKENARRLGLDHICEFRGGDLLEPVRDVQADVLIGDVSGIPDAIAAESGWFADVRARAPHHHGLPLLPGAAQPVLTPALERQHDPPYVRSGAREHLGRATDLMTRRAHVLQQGGDRSRWHLTLDLGPGAVVFRSLAHDGHGEAGAERDRGDQQHRGAFRRPEELCRRRE